jgi:hypothetical protein
MEKDSNSKRRKLPKCIESRIYGNTEESYVPAKAPAIVYAKVPPKPLQKGPRYRENTSGPKEYLMQFIVGLENNRAANKTKINKKVNRKIIGMYAGDVNKNDQALTESYDSFNIAKPAGYGTFMTAADLGIKIKGGFAHHPTVEEEIEKRTGCECGCGKPRNYHKVKKIRYKNRKHGED